MGSADKGVYFHYWDGTAPAFNDGANGLERLDYVVAAAKARGLRLVLPLTNNWSDFGGIDQYVRWANGQYHGDFYTNPQIKQRFKDSISHLLNRTNSITGVKYKDEPAIMTWELGNEPRCKGSGVYPADPACSTGTITSWAAEMSAYIKSIDHNHLVSSGSEGFLCEPDKPGAADDWTRNCGEGVDELAISKLKTIDVMSYHLYPDSWGKAADASWSANWIVEHIKLADSIHKPSMLGEYGWKNKATRNPVYKSWTDTVLRWGGDGALYWILSDIQDDDTLYPDYDGFTVYCPSPVCTTIANFADAMRLPGVQLTFPPVADNDSAVTDYQVAATLTPAANDIAYGPGNAVLAQTIDLDPATAGQQKTLTLAGEGAFALQSDGSVVFTPEPTYFGLTTISYTIKDRLHRTSNAANISVRVIPPPPPPTLMYGFESGTEGWGDSWEHPGVVSQSSDWATEGSYSLKAVTDNGDWFATYSIPSPPAGYTWANYRQITIDVKTLGAGSSLAMAFQTGPSWSWCQSGFPWIPANTETTVTVDLLGGLSCNVASLSDIRAILLYMNGNATVYVDNIVAS